VWWANIRNCYIDSMSFIFLMTGNPIVSEDKTCDTSEKFTFKPVEADIWLEQLTCTHTHTHTEHIPRELSLASDKVGIYVVPAGLSPVHSIIGSFQFLLFVVRHVESMAHFSRYLCAVLLS